MPGVSWLGNLVIMLFWGLVLTIGEEDDEGECVAWKKKDQHV